MRNRSALRGARLVIALGVLLGIGLVASSGEGIDSVGAGNQTEVAGISLAEYGVPIAIMGQLTQDSEPIDGTFFFLFYDPLGTNAKDQCGMQFEHRFPEGTKANGAQIAFIQSPNGIVTFTIAPSQFQLGLQYVLPFLPEDPPGQGALEFF